MEAITKNVAEDPDTMLSQNNIAFKNDVSNLSLSTKDLFSQMMDFDVDIRDNYPRILEIGNLIKTKIDGLFVKHLVLEVERRMEVLRVEMEKLKDHKEAGVIGDSWTYLALKNTSSYLIGTHQKGLKMIEENSEVYSGRLPIKDRSLRDVIYIPTENCYLLNHNDQLFRKDIDENPPYLYMNLSCSARFGASFKYSTTQKRLIIIEDWKKISSVNLLTKKVEITVAGSVEGYLNDFKVFGPQDTQVASLTRDGYLFLYKMNYNQRQGSILGSYKIDLMKERDEEAKSLAVCDKDHHVLVEIGQFDDPYISPRMILLAIDKNNNNFTLKASIDCFNQNLGQKLCMDCYGYAGRDIIWVGFSGNENGVVQMYAYNMEREELKELEEKRVNHQEYYPVKVQRVGGEFYYTGWSGRVMELRINF